MQLSETKTAEGSGFWGHGVYEIELRTRRVNYTDSSGNNSRTISQYHLGFRRDQHSDIRTFKSDHQRSDFINKHFSQLTMREIPQHEQVSASIQSPLTEVIGNYLSSVTFVMDYLQMSFCGPGFSFYNWPTVILPKQQSKVGDEGYRDALCALVGKTVQSLDVFLDTGLHFVFREGETITASLRAPAGSTMLEVAEYWSGKKSRMIWSSGEEPFNEPIG